MKKILYTIVLLLGISHIKAQQLSDYNFYRDNWMLLNPASFSENYLFNSSTHTLGVTGRYQWTELEEAPTTIGLQYQAVLEALNIGLGATLLNDQTGAIGTTGLYGTFSYIMPLQKSRSRVTQFLSFGINARMVQYRVNFSEITFNEPNQASTAMDNHLQYYPDFGLGVFYYIDNRFYMGASMPQLLNLNTQYTRRDESFSIERQAHYYAIMGGFIPFGGRQPTFYLEPSIWLRYVENTPISLDANLRLNFQNAFWLGAGYSISNTFHLDMGYTLQNRFSRNDWLKIGLGYTYNANTFGIELGNTFELNMTYAWGKSSRLICPFE